MSLPSKYDDATIVAWAKGLGRPLRWDELELLALRSKNAPRLMRKLEKIGAVAKDPRGRHK